MFNVKVFDLYLLNICKEYWTSPYSKQNYINTVLQWAEYITTCCYNFNCINAWRPCSFSLWKLNTIAKWDYIYFTCHEMDFSSINALQNSHLITSRRSLHLDGTHAEYYARMVQSFKHYGSESKLMVLHKILEVLEAKRKFSLWCFITCIFAIARSKMVRWNMKLWTPSEKWTYGRSRDGWNRD